MTPEKLDNLLRQVIGGFDDSATADQREIAKRAAEALAAELTDPSKQKEAPASGSTDPLDRAIALLTQMVEAKKAKEGAAAKKADDEPVVVLPSVPLIPGGG